jgi:hypothetical protein
MARTVDADRLAAPPDATIGLLVSHFWTQRAAAFRVPDPAANRDLFVQLA